MLALKARHASAVAPHLRHRLAAIAAPHRVRYYAVVATSAVPQKSKVWDSVDEAVKDVKSGDVLLSGGALPFFFHFHHHYHHHDHHSPTRVSIYSLFCFYQFDTLSL